MATLNGSLNVLKAARITDVDTGHGCFPASDVIVGSGDVFFNDLEIDLHSHP